MTLLQDIETAVVSLVGRLLEPERFHYDSSWQRFYQSSEGVTCSIGLDLTSSRRRWVRVAVWLGVRLHALEDLLAKSRPEVSDSAHRMTVLTDAYHLVDNFSAREWRFSSVEELASRAQVIERAISLDFLPFLDRIGSIEGLEALVSAGKGSQYIAPGRRMEVELALLILAGRWEDAGLLLAGTPPSEIPLRKRGDVQVTVGALLSQFPELKKGAGTEWGD